MSTHTSICAVFESNGERYTTRELTVQLRLCSSSADRTPGDEIGNVLWRNGVEQLRADGNTELSEIAEELAC